MRQRFKPKLEGLLPLGWWDLVWVRYLAAPLGLVALLTNWYQQRHSGTEAAPPTPLREDPYFLLLLLALLWLYFWLVRWRIRYRRNKKWLAIRNLSGFTQALGPLGAMRSNGEPDVAVRLGAVMVLERLALMDKSLPPMVMETLSTYLRRNSKAWSEGAAKTQKRAAGPAFKQPEDLLASLAALARLNAKFDEKNRPDLGGLDLSYVVLDHLNLSGYDLSHFNLSGANLSEAALANARLAQTNLTSADLSRAQFAHANMKGVCLDQTQLTGANFHGASLKNASFYLAKVEGFGPLHDNPNHTELDMADLAGADLSRVECAQPAAAQWQAIRRAKNWEKAFLPRRLLDHPPKGVAAGHLPRKD